MADSTSGKDLVARQAMLKRRMAQAEAQARQRTDEQSSFKQFSASQLYCPKCKRAMPVREKLLLVLGDGDLYDYTCVQCGSSLGSRKG